ncbi:potassium-transporting ATPase subunit KdpC [Stieleria varia]|uniref:Potassium-transporting ATPase KdpC subunit n=1 Tax=Stieleria varia TaxID=2528005 RepID=A0A5C6B3Z9_9BACT|nr:potassium-transporting ATPase subunit KdpC [Stieleria varia]TWU06282.1 Potassium-transporting ATPase C chain [Stieleria varia]
MNNFFSSLRLTVSSLVICSVIYPAVILGFAMVAAPESRQGSLIRNETGEVIGSRLIAQSFTRPGYFWPRPSAVDYDASATGGSNLSPTNPALTQRAAGGIAKLNLKSGQKVPADLVAASGSGLDPHISLASAKLQADRVAASRGLPLSVVESLIQDNLNGRALVVLGGEPIVNVLTLNIALDQAIADKE